MNRAATLPRIIVAKCVPSRPCHATTLHAWTRLLALSDVCRRPLTAHWAGDLVPGNPILDERSARFFDAVMMVLRILRRAHIDDDGTVVDSSRVWWHKKTCNPRVLSTCAALAYQP
ncbi:hypothetical protein RI054_23g98080 [Pseudoscourfieldia marina]